jgi:Tfp pilus assembly protein PilP
MTTNIRRTLVALAVAASMPAGAAAQQPQGQKPPAPPAAQPAPAKPPAVEAPAAPGAYSYKADGRRDPFVSLIGRPTDARTGPNRPSGLAGLLINELTVTGIVRGVSGFTAVLRGPDNKTHIVRSGDRLMDGTVKSISEKQVIFSQDVNDPLSLIKQREIPKSVRPGGGESKE